MLDIIIYGTNEGVRPFYQTTEGDVGVFKDCRGFGGYEPLGQAAYSIEYTKNGVAFTKWLIIDDVQSDSIGFMAIAVAIHEGKKLKGKQIIYLLNRLAKEYQEKYLNKYFERNNSRGDWAFVDDLKKKFEAKIKPTELTNSSSRGEKEAAYIYYSSKELAQFFNAPYQPDYADYKQVFFVDQKYKGQDNNPLNALRHSKEANLTEKKILKNLSYRNPIQGAEENSSTEDYEYKRFAQQGDANAQFNLAEMYHKGEEVEQDDEKAVYWYKKSAEQGNANAQFNLAEMYDKGKGVEQDDEKADYWYQKSAEHESIKPEEKAVGVSDKNESQNNPAKKGMFSNPFSFNGRIRRTEYGISFIIFVIVRVFVTAIMTSGEARFMVVAYIPMLWFLWAQGAKRCHDIGHSGWWQLIPFYFFWMLFQDGQPELNEYGYNPKGRQLRAENQGLSQENIRLKQEVTNLKQKSKEEEIKRPTTKKNNSTPPPS